MIKVTYSSSDRRRRVVQYYHSMKDYLIKREKWISGSWYVIGVQQLSVGEVN